MLIELAPGVMVDEADLSVSFIASSGPGGQNVNKVATAAQLRFNLAGSEALAPAVKQRMVGIAGSKLSRDGVIVITARRFRSQEQNRDDAYGRLAEMILEARIKPVFRVKTKPSFGEKQRRLEAKSVRAKVKKNRGRVSDD